MKKIILLLAIAILPILTGCGNENKLTCSRTRKVYTQTRIIEFNSDKTKATTSSIEVTYDFTNVSDFSDFDGCDDAKSCLKIAESIVDDCKKNGSFERCEIIERTSNKVVIKGYYTKEKLEKELGNDDYKEIRGQLESSGYECK